MNNIRFFLLALFSSLIVFTSIAQDGRLDPTFNTFDKGSGMGLGAEDFIMSLCAHDNNKVIVGGSFTSFDGQPTGGLIRLFSNGKIDTTFHPPITIEGAYMNSILRQPDSKLLLGGGFMINGKRFFGVVRLLPDGRLDPGFYPGSIESNYIHDLVLLPDGKILVAGGFTTYDLKPFKGLVRLNANGTVDLSFRINSETSAAEINTITVQPDGKILIGGGFSTYNNSHGRCLARLNADGTSDVSFNTGGGANDYVWNTLLQPDGKIIITGLFTEYDGIKANHIARLHPNGSLDASFISGDGADKNIFYSVLTNQGKLLIQGDFTTFNGTRRRGLAQINSDGSLDQAFVPELDIRSYDAFLQPDGKILYSQITYGSLITRSSNLGRLLSNGQKELGYPEQTGLNGPVLAMAIQQDEKILAGGHFTFYNEKFLKSLIRIHPSGIQDTSFHFSPGEDEYPDIHSIVVQNDKKILIAGTIDSSVNFRGRGIARLNPNGSTDTSFHAGIDIYGMIRTAVVQPNGRILIIGPFDTYNHMAQNGLARLLPNGTLDTSFRIGSGPDSRFIYAIALQKDGKILIAGNWTSYNSTPILNLARLLPDGKLDTSFHVGLGALGTIYALALQDDGKILAGGQFTSYDGVAKRNLVRLNTNGKLDNNFLTGTGPNEVVYALEIQKDEKILAAGNFTEFNSVASPRIVRLLSNGNPDPGFQPGNGADRNINKICVQENGKILIGGNFLRYDGVGRNFLARLNNEVSLPLGLDDQQEVSQIQVFPNPASEVLHIANHQEESFSLLNFQGFPVRTWRVRPNSNAELTIKGLESGLYILQGNTTLLRGKVIVK